MDNEVTAIEIGADGSVWCGSYRYGLSRYVNKKWQVLQTRDELLTNDISDMDVTGGGENTRIILSHLYQGVSLFNSGKWKTFAEYGDLTGGALAVNLEPDGTFWVDTFEGLAYFDGKLWETYLDDPKVGYSQFSTIYFISDRLAGSIFAGNEQGVMEFAQGKWQTLPSLDGKEVYAVRLAGDGALYFATDNGVYIRSNGHWKFNTRLEGLPGNVVLGLVVAADGSVWASSCEGLAQLRNGKWVIKAYSDKNTGCFRRLAIDPWGALWVTTTHGLFRYKDGMSNLILYPGLSGSAELYDHGIKIDETGVIWIATASGLFQYQYR